VSRTRRGENSRNEATDLEEHESEAERALREALRVEPSPALVGLARAELSRPRPVHVSPWLAAAAATVVVIVGLAILRSPTAIVPEPRRSHPQTAQGGVVSPAVPPAQAAAMERIEPRPRLRVEGRGHGTRERPWPAAEIVVEPGQAEALVRLADLALAGEVTLPGSLLHAEADPGRLLPPEPVRIEPLAIAPLDPPVVAEPGLSGRGDW
jgi:hypothetical protein